MRHVLSRFNYPDKDPEIVGTPDPRIVGSALAIFEQDERPARFPPLAPLDPQR